MKLRITVEGVTYEVDVEVVDDGAGTAPPPPPAAPAAPRTAPSSGPSSGPSSAPAAAPAGAAPAPAPGNGDKFCKSPIAGTILAVKVKPGDRVAVNQVLLVMEAMKMETNVASPAEGVVAKVLVEKGTVVRQGQPLVEFA